MRAARQARQWTETARLEHASIAAFARFVLQLMALGAPAELVAADVLATIATDEARHAELAWRCVAWMVRAFGQEARDALESALGAALTDGSERGAIRGEALRAIVTPLTRALIATREESPGPAAPRGELGG